MKGFDTVLLDLNGTLYQRGIALPGVNDTLKRLRENELQISFLTNTDSKSSGDLLRMVVEMGLAIAPGEIFTPVSAAKAYTAANPGKTFYPLVHDSVLADLKEVNWNAKDPDYVIIGDFSDKVSYQVINHAFRLIKGGAEIIALAKTLWYIDVDGYSINTGAFVRMFETACEKEALLLGKPSPAFFRLALARSGGRPKNSLVVGDDIATDVRGAKQINAGSVLVRTGLFDAAALAAAGDKPDAVIEDVNQLPRLLGI